MQNLQIKDLTTDQVADLRKQLKELDKPKGYWKPGMNEKYWYVTSGGMVDYMEFPIDETEFVGEQGNVFKTREEAEEHLKYLQALGRVRMYILDNHYFEPDWGDEDQEKYWIEYNHFNNSLDMEDDCSLKHINILPFLPSSKAASDVIDNCKDDLKIIFNVK